MNKIATNFLQSLLFSLSLLLLAGCHPESSSLGWIDEGVDIVLHATIGDNQSSSRAMLSPTSDQLGYTARWQEGDEVHLYIKQAGKLYDLGTSKLTDLKDDGASAVFRVKFPSGVDSAKELELIGVSGRHSYMEDGEVRINVSHHNRTLSEVRPLLYFKHQGPILQTLTVRFKHLCVYEVVHITNTTKSPIDVKGAMLHSSTLWYVSQLQQPVAYITTSGVLASAPTGSQATIDREAALQRASVSIPAGGEGVMVNSYVLPFGEGMRVQDVYLSAEIGGAKRQTTHFGSSASLLNGCAYHIFATWDGAQLLLRGEKVTYGSGSIEDIGTGDFVNDGGITIPDIPGDELIEEHGPIIPDIPSTDL